MDDVGEDGGPPTAAYAVAVAVPDAVDDAAASHIGVSLINPSLMVMMNVAFAFLSAVSAVAVMMAVVMGVRAAMLLLRRGGVAVGRHAHVAVAVWAERRRLGHK